MEEYVPSEPVFRANKRRKVLRKRTDADGEEVWGASAATLTSNGVVAGGIKEQGEEGEESVRTLQRARRLAARKHGVACSSASRWRHRQDTEASEATLAIQPNREGFHATQIDRFVKPTGCIVVEDDKHITAFIDSKLAEMRSATPNMNAQSSSGTVDLATYNPEEQRERQSARDKVSAATRAQNTRHQPKYKRQPPVRDASEIARESLVDQIMRESAVPLYDRSTCGAPLFATEAGDDPEAAAAEAFKQQFLMDMEEQNRRRPPNPPPFSKVAAAKGADRTAHGPKLGGSRQQRERHKAAEAAAKAIEQEK